VLHLVTAFVGHAFVAAAKCPSCEVLREWNDELRIENRRLQELISTPQVVQVPDLNEDERSIPIIRPKVTRRQMLRKLSRDSARASRQDREAADKITAEVEL
jgi:hypothetical protein